MCMMRTVVNGTMHMSSRRLPNSKYNSKYKTNKINQLDENSILKSKYKCRICKKKFSKFSFLEGHFAFNAKCRLKRKTLLQCFICKQGFHHLATLKYHLHQHSSNNQCKQTHSHCPDVNIQSDHVPNQKNRTNVIKCNICYGRNFRTKFHLSEHMLRHSKRNDKIRQMELNKASDHKQLKESSLTCTICKLVCSTVKCLDDHLKVHIDGELECEICKVPFTTKRSLVIHETRLHPHQHLVKKLISKALKRNVQKEHITPEESQKARINGGYPRQAGTGFQTRCEICQVICDNTEQLAKHMKIHIDGKFKCEVCDIWFTKSTLVSHEKRHHPDVRRQRILDRLENPVNKKTKDEHAFKKKDTWKLHKQTNSYNCRQPLLTSNHLSDLKQFVCKFCKKVFTGQAYLTNHTKTHKFQCYVCKKYFEKNDLKPHLNTHILYQLWVDPLNIHLSNWSPSRYREILENLPLVMVENLNIKEIDLKSLTHFGQRINIGNEALNEGERKCTINESLTVPATENRYSHSPPSKIENDPIQTSSLNGHSPCPLSETDSSKIENDPIQTSSLNGYSPCPPSETDSSEIELNPIQTTSVNGYPHCPSLKQDSSEIENNPIQKCEPDILPENSLLMNNNKPVISQEISDSESVDNSVIDVSSASDSDIEEIEDGNETFSCYFCDKLFQSLNGLGCHYKKCTLNQGVSP